MPNSKWVPRSEPTRVRRGINVGSTCNSNNNSAPQCRQERSFSWSG